MSSDVAICVYLEHLECGASKHGEANEPDIEAAYFVFMTMVDFIRDWNAGDSFSEVKVPVHLWLGDITYPEGASDRKPIILGNDYVPIDTGTSILYDRNGKEVAWTGEPVVPCFIGEASYSSAEEGRVAMSMCRLVEMVL